MTGFLVTVGVIVAAVVGLALALPCPACRARRERLARAYAEWRRAKQKP